MQQDIITLSRFIAASAETTYGDEIDCDMMAAHYSMNRVEDALGMNGVRDGERMEEWAATLVAAYWRSLRP